MDSESQAKKGEPFSLVDHVTYAIGAVVSKTLTKNDSGNITLFSFDKGQGLSEHTAPFDAVVYLLDGKARITIGGEPKDVVAGQMLIMPANIPHSLHAEEPFKMMLVMIRAKGS